MTTSTTVLRNVVNGVPVASVGAALPLVSPVTGEVYAHAPISTADEVDAAFAAASRAFETWKRTTPAQRQLLLFRLADALEAHAEEFADLESQDTGKPRANLVADEIVQSIDQLRFFAGAARDLDGRAAAEYAEGFTSYVRREPIGVVAQVTPWNYPLNMAVWKIGPALAAGNTVVLKPSETTPQTTVRLAELAAEIFPAGVLNVVLGDRETGRMLVEHPTPQLVAITGSVRAGMQVAASAAQSLKRVHLELGGKAPALVFADADLDRAARGIVEAAFFNAGQDCTAATRVLVDAAVHDELVAKLVAHTRDHAKAGAPDDPDAFFGPVNNPDQLARVQGFVDRLPSHAAIAIGGHRQGDAAASSRRRSSRASARTTRSCSRRSSARCSRCSRSRRRRTRSRWPTGCRTPSRHPSGRASTRGRCGSRAISTSAASGSTRTSRSSRTCHTAASSTPGTARISRSTGSRTTPASSTSWRAWTDAGARRPEGWWFCWRDTGGDESDVAGWVAVTVPSGQ